MKQVFTNRQERDQFWQDHLEKARSFEGSNLQYCRQNLLNPSTFWSNKERLGFVDTDKKPSAKRFARVKIVSPKVDDKSTRMSSKLNSQGPDAGWLADFVVELMRDR